MTANARIPIDLNDPKIPLIEGLKTLLEFTAAAGQKTFQDNKRETHNVKHLLYVMLNGYLPRENDFTLVNGVYTLYGWTPGMLYHSSRSLAREGVPEFQREMDYCNIRGDDLEESQESLEHTKGLLKTKSKLYPQQATVLFNTINEFFTLEGYPTNDHGLFGQLLRFVDMYYAFHIRIHAGQDAITRALEQLVAVVYPTLEQIRKQELKIRYLIDLDERARRVEPGSRDNLFGLQVLQNHIKGSLGDKYINEATRNLTVSLLTSHYRDTGRYVTLSSVYNVIRRAHMEINATQGEIGLVMYDDIDTVGSARVMYAQARPAFADRNGRGGQGSPTKDELRKMIADRDRLIAEKENMIAQDRANKEKAKKARTEAYSQGKPAYTQAQTEAYQQRCQKRAAALEGQGQGARKKPSPQKVQPQQQQIPAKGYMLRTGPDSDDDEDY